MFDVLEDTSQPIENAEPDIAPGDLVEELAAVLAHRDRIEARAADLLRRIGESGAFRRDGYSSLTALLKHRMSLHPGEAQRLVARSNGLANAPLIGFAYARGAISGAQVDVLLEARSIAPEAFAESEQDLVALALDTPLTRDLRRRLDYWLDSVASDDLADDRCLVRELRALTLRRDGEMMRINGWVDIEAGERLRSGLEPGLPADGDTRSTAARRADLLLDIMNGASDRPDITVHVTATALTGHSSGISESGDGSFLNSQEVRRIACDSNVRRVIFDSKSLPLDVGRTHRLVTPGLRAALAARDLRCVFPGCDRPSRWCDAHHLVHWADGGETSIENLVLLCRHHHVLVHDGGWTTTGTPGDLRFFRSDGTELEGDRRHRSLDSAFFKPGPPTPPPVDLRDLIREVRAIRFSGP
jgi:Domain of unknown function (DUF222)/HNH endonuclease